MVNPSKAPRQLAQDAQFWQLYEKVETVGRGHFAKVALARNCSSGAHCATKLINKRLYHDPDRVVRELEMVQALRHPNIMRVEEAYETITTLILVCEFAAGGDVMHRIAAEKSVYAEAEVQRHLKAVLSAVGFMHERGAVHRDLKPENILLSDPTPQAHCVLADFGLARFVSHDDEMMTTICGTHRYWPPELVLCDRGARRGYTRAVDVWGIGLVAYIMLTGRNPFLRDSTPATCDAIVRGSFEFPKTEGGLSQPAKELIRRMLALDEAARITCTEAMADAWLAAADPNRSEGTTAGGEESDAFHEGILLGGLPVRVRALQSRDSSSTDLAARYSSSTDLAAQHRDSSCTDLAHLAAPEGTAGPTGASPRGSCSASTSSSPGLVRRVPSPFDAAGAIQRCDLGK